MALNLQQKKEVVAELADVTSKAMSMVAAEYAGLTVAQLLKLRVEARKTGVYLRVVKNSLVERAVAGTEFEGIQGKVSGPLIYAFSMDDPGAAGRLVKDFAKTNDKLVAKVVAVGGQVFGGKDLDRLASLPTRDQALSMLLGCLVQPATMLVRVLAEPANQLARAIKAVGDSKQAAEAA